MIILWLLVLIAFPPKADGQTIYSSDFIVVHYIVDKDALVKGIILSTAHTYNVSSELMLAIAQCESGFKPDAQNPTSTASGIFQWLTSSFISSAQAYEVPLDKNSVEVQAELTAKVIAVEGTAKWDASQDCWNK